jgi:hypothetical protein
MLSRFGWKVPYKDPLYWIGYIGLLIGGKTAGDGPIPPGIALIVMLVGSGLMFIADYRLNKGHPALGSPAYWVMLICVVIGLVVWPLQGYGPKVVTLIMCCLGFVIWYVGLRHSNKTG